MQSLAEKTVRELASTNPGAARIFERFGIDYCCGGERSLTQACTTAKTDLGQVVTALETSQPQAVERDWQKATLSELIQHIVEKHHAFVRQEIPRLRPQITKVLRVHGPNHQELFQIEISFHALAEELTLHMMKEERMLFPYIERLEIAERSGGRPAPPMFGTVQNPVRMMMMEHDSAGELLHKMRQVTSNYTLPADACMSFRTLYAALQEFEVDLHQHIHLENNLLFPRAIELESKAA